MARVMVLTPSVWIVALVAFVKLHTALLSALLAVYPAAYLFWFHILGSKAFSAISRI